jgi:tRNA-dihydrouridine synthase B
MMAEAAQFNVAQGAEIIDINMGCPAKKVCKRAAGSALLRDPELVARILSAVVNAVEVPVTLKIRTGWDRQNRNASEIAKIAEQSGIQALAVHGRTKACRFVGEVEYDSIAEVVDTISIPVFANGDITSAPQAQTVLKKTGASAVMIGRGAQGNPWIFNQINHYLEHGELLAEPTLEEVGKVMTKHLTDLHEFYGEVGGVRISRKHIGWYSRWLDDGKAFTKIFNQHETRLQQQQQLSEFFSKYSSQERAA